MKAIVFEAPRRLRLVDDAPVPAPEDRQVLVRCTHVGLCGSSMGAYTAEGCWAAARRPSAPGWMGHENVGVIVDSRHPDWRAGTRVLAQPKYWDGFAEYFVAAAEETVRLPEDAPDPGAYVVAQPLATVLHALSRTGPVIGQRCAVVGQGPIGLIFTEILSRMGAEQVIAIDLVGWRLEWARRLGATDVVDASTGDAIQDVRDLTSGAMVDLSVEAGNTAEALVLAARLPRRKGRLVPFGVQHEEMTLFPWAFSNGNCTEILCSNGRGGLLRSAVGWIARGRTDLACIVTPRLPWCRAEETFEMYTHPAAHPGEQVYGKQRFTTGRAAFSASPWAYDGKIFCLSETGETYVVEAGPKFRVLHVNRLDEAALATPAVARDSLILRTLTKLYRIANTTDIRRP